MKRLKLLRVLRILLLICLVLGIYIFIEPYWLETRFIEFENKDIPYSFNGKKIVFVSDIHHGPNFSRARVQSLVKHVNDLKPDIILLGGDYIEGAKYALACFEELKNLNAPLGKFGVLGNHDHWENEVDVREGMKSAGIKILDNKAQWITIKGGGIKIGGVGDMYADNQNIKPTVNDVQEEDFVILLSHNPDYVEEIKNYKVDIVLSGHTHGGQVTLFGQWAPVIPSNYGQKYRVGEVRTDYTKVYISRGIGSTGIPIRFFSRPEVTVFNLKKK